MFGSIGGPELIVIFVVALLIFGPRKLPELGRSVGRGLAEFRKAATDLRETLDREVTREDTPPQRGLPAADAPRADGPKGGSGTSGVASSGAAEVSTTPGVGTADDGSERDRR